MSLPWWVFHVYATYCDTPTLFPDEGALVLQFRGELVLWPAASQCEHLVCRCIQKAKDKGIRKDFFGGEGGEGADLFFSVFLSFEVQSVNFHVCHD